MIHLLTFVSLWHEAGSGMILETNTWIMGKSISPKLAEVLSIPLLRIYENPPTKHYSHNSGAPQKTFAPLSLQVHVYLALFVYFILSRVLYLAFSGNLGPLYMPHPGMGPLA